LESLLLYDSCPYVEIDRSALVRLAGFGGVTAIALAANQLGLGEHSASLLAGVAALLGEGARAVWGHLGVHMIEKVAGHSGGEEHARGAQNHDLHRLIGETIARILEREAEVAPGGKSGGNYLKQAAKAFQGNVWMTVELIGAEAAVGEAKVPVYFKGDAESIKKAAVLEPAEWIALVEKVAGPATFAEYEEQGGLALGGGRQALEYAANRLHEHFAFDLWEAVDWLQAGLVENSIHRYAAPANDKGGGMQDNWVDFKAIKAGLSIEAVLEHYKINWLRKRTMS